MTTVSLRQRLVARLGAVTAALMAATAIAVVPSSVATADPLPPAAVLTSAFTTYGDTAGRWAGGDGTVSVELPDGRIAWLFSDTFVGSVNADHSLPAATTMVNNTIVIQSGSQLTGTLTGGTEQAPASVVATGVTDEFYWIGDAIVENGTLKAMYNRYRRIGTGSLDFVFLNSAVATFALPSLSLTGVTDLTYGSDIAWGASLLTDAGYTYIYGTELTAGGGMKFAHLARVSAGGLSGSWEFWTGSAWSTDATASARLLSGVGANFGVQKIGAEYVIVTSESNLPFNPQVVAYTAASPAGPFTGPIDLFTAPEPAAATAGQPIVVYNAQSHLEQAATGTLLISYDVNSLNIADVRADIRNYRPRFVEVGWPKPTPDPAAAPPAPTELTATAEPSGIVHLAWQPQPNVTFTVYQRDVTSGQTHFARVSTTSVDSADVNYLSTARTYEFRVTATNAAGEGAASAAASAEVVIAPPPAPTGVTAVADETGGITISWNPVPYAWNYDLYRRDVTAGETVPMRANGVVVSGSTTSFTNTDILQHQHVYEFTVVARHGGGDSPHSTPATATAFYAVPGAPTGLTANAEADGTITLEWTTPGPDVWFNVYQRDVTAGELEFTKLPLPITSCCTMSAGYLSHNHQYEYKVAATNAGGESPHSSVAIATAIYALPAAPTGLTATAEADGTITLAWTTPGPDVWFNVYQRDVTAGDTEFTKLPLPITSCCTMTAGYLSHNHQYEYKAAATNAGGEGPHSSVASAIATYPAPVTPAGLTAVAGSGQAVLTWTGAQDSWFNVYQRDVTAGEVEFTKLPLPITSCCTMTAGYLTNGHTYEWKVTATTAAGESSASNPASATAQATPPGQVTGLTASANGDGSVTLAWTPPSGSGLWFDVYQRDVTAGEAEFTKLPLPVTTCCTITIGQGFNIHNHVYEYKMAATNGAIGPLSAVATATAYYNPPADAPTSLRGVSAGNGTITLDWDGPQYHAFWIYMRDVTAGQSSFTKLPYPVMACCTFTGGYLAHGHTYEWKVSAANQGGEGPASIPIQVTAYGGLPEAPANLNVAPGDGQAVLSWTASPTTGVGYWVYQRDVTAGQSWQKLSLPILSCCTMTAGYLANGHTYEWKVTAYNWAGDSAASNVVSGKPMPPLPQAPTNLSASTGDGTVRLTWTASSTLNVYYVIYQRDRTVSQSWQRLPYPVTSCCVFNGGLLTNGHDYEWKIVANNMTGDSGYSNTVGGRPMPPVPQAPSGLSASVGDATVTLTWTASPTPNVGYWVYQRDVTAGQSWQKLPYPVMSCCTFHGGYLTNGHTYEWKLAAGNIAGLSSYTNTVSARPMPPMPQPLSGLSASVGDAKVTLKWTASPTPNVGYWVYQRDVTTGQSWQKLPYPVMSCCTFNGGLLINGHTYEWKMTAGNITGVSGYSNTVSGKPMPPVPTAPANLSIANWLSSDRQKSIVYFAWTPSTTSGVTYTLYYLDVSSSQTSWHTTFISGTSSASFSFFTGGHRYAFMVSARNLSGEKFTNVAYENVMRNKREQYYYLTDAGAAAYDRWYAEKSHGGCVRNCSGNNHAGDAYAYYWSDDMCSAPWYGRDLYDYIIEMACVRHDFGYRNHGSVYLYDENERYRIDHNTMELDAGRLCDNYDYPWIGHPELTDCYNVIFKYYTAIRWKGENAWDENVGKYPPR